MSLRNAWAVADEKARLYLEAARLTEEFCARVRAGDESGGAAFTKAREAIFQRIAGMAPAPETLADDPGRMELSWHQSVAAIERIIELDREVLTLLEGRKAQVGHELAEIGRGRQSLASYRGAAAVTPTFLDRVS